MFTDGGRKASRGMRRIFIVKPGRPEENGRIVLDRFALTFVCSLASASIHLHPLLPIRL
jgi:hypothetical protein